MPSSMGVLWLDGRDASIRLRCPACGAGVRARDEVRWHCDDPSMPHSFPLVDGVPILLNAQRSIFRFEDFKPRARTTFKEPSGWALRIGRVLPSPSRDVSTEPCYRRLADALRQRPADRRRVLVVGCGDGTAGYGELLGVEGVSMLETDVSLAGSARIVCDASDLPFAAEQFDLVICVAVLEHVLEPQRCVDEIHRVLREDGLVYATMPFMQQVHMGEYDFTRLTRSGLRWLFREFSLIDTGISTGPASALVWSVQYFALSWSTSVAGRRIAKAVVRLMLGWLTWLDPILAQRTPALDAAAGTYFVGRRAEVATVSARDLITYYRGGDALK